jgi:hypothetical protein
LFPELVESQILLTNGRLAFSASLEEFVLAAILYFAKDFRRTVRNQTRWHCLGAVRRAGDMWADGGDFVLWRHVPGSTDPLVDHFYKPEERREMIARCDYIVARPH